MKKSPKVPCFFIRFAIIATISGTLLTLREHIYGTISTFFVVVVVLNANSTELQQNVVISIYENSMILIMKLCIAFSSIQFIQCACTKSNKCLMHSCVILWHQSSLFTLSLSTFSLHSICNALFSIASEILSIKQCAVDCLRKKPIPCCKCMQFH